MSVFHEYDIRGSYPEEINEGFAYNLARALVVLTQKKNLMVGVDARAAGPSLRAAFIEGAKAQGADVTDAGLITTSQLIPLRAWHGHEAAAMITASHLPLQFTGFKLIGADGHHISAAHGLAELEKLMTKGEYPTPARKGILRVASYLSDYAARIVRLCKPAVSVSFVADASNGAVGPELKLYRSKYGMNLHILNDTPDGTNPAHSLNPLDPSALSQAREAIIATKSAGGCVFDGDADRIVFLDEKGKTINTNHVACMIIQRVLKSNPGAAIVYDLISSRVVHETIQANGGTPVRSPVGHSNIHDKMSESSAVFGAESSGHMMYRDTLNAEATTLTMLMIMRILEEEGVSFSQHIRRYDVYATLTEHNFKVDDADAAIDAFEKAFPDGTTDHLDGVFVQFAHGWLSLRKSNTEPLVRLRGEALTQAELDFIFKRAEQVLLGVGARQVVRQ